jgi:hypothetical protein
VLKQEQSGVVVTLSGSHFRAGGAVSVSGTGVAVSAPTWIANDSFRVTLTVAADAPYGSRTITYTQPADGGAAAASLVNALVVHAPDPVLTAVSPTIVKQGSTSVVVTLTGDKFRDRGIVHISGPGLTQTSVTRLSATRYQVVLDVDAFADYGVRAVAYQQPADGGGAMSILASGITVHAPDPVVTAVFPTSVVQGTGPTTLALTGTGFRTGGRITVSGTGLTLGTTTFVSPTNATVTVTTAIDATMGTRNVTWTQPAAGGGASGTANGILAVHAPNPTVTAITPNFTTQGDGAATFTLTGTNFRDGGSVTLGAGITVTSPTRLSDTSFRVTLATAIDAALGLRDVTYAQPAIGGGAAATLTSGFRVNAPTPVVTSVSPATIQQGKSNVTLTVTGNHFRTGGALTISGTGLTLGATTVVSATQATVSVTAASNASVGARSVTFTQPAVGGSAAGTGTNLLTIHYPDPTVTAVAPTIVEQGTSGTFTLTGTNFRAGGTVTTTGTGVTLSSPAWVSDTSFTVAYTAAANAALTSRDLTYTQPADGGAASATKTAAYLVMPPAPTLTSIAPATFAPGSVRVSTRLTGTNYNSGTAVSVSGAGVTVHSTAFVSTTTLDVVLSVASDTAPGLRSVTITPATGGGPARTFSNVVTIAAPAPILDSFSHATLAQGATSVNVTVLGTNFRSGDTLSASGSGVTFASVTVVNTSKITALATVTGTATTGLRNLTVTHSATDGAQSDTLANAFRVVGGVPTVSAVSPGAVGVTGTGGATREVPLQITGTNFMTGASVTVTRTGGSGVSVVSGSATVVSDVRLDVTISLTGAATTGLWDVTVSNPGGLGSSGATGAGLLDVKPSTTLAVNRVRASSGSAYGGENVTIEGSGFVDGCSVDFGTVRASGTQVLDANTLVTIVPAPATLSLTAATLVNVKVTTPSATSATLTNGYTYAKDDVRFVVASTVPAQGATAVARNQKSAVVVLTAPFNAGTGLYGTITGTNCFWFESGGAFTPSGVRATGPGGRFLVLSRTTTGSLPIASAGLYVLDLPTTLRSVGGNAFVPTRLASTQNHDQYTFTLSATATDVTAPGLGTIVPANGATGVDPMTRVVLTFNEALDPSTVSLGTITFTRGGTTVPATIALSDDLKTVTITPENELAASTTYTVSLTAGVADLCGNAFSALTRTFTTSSGTDTTAPTVDAVVVESLPASVDGSGTYVSSAGTAGQAFDLYLPRDGWSIDVAFSDAGGAGIDPTTFSAKCSVAVGSSAANAELASNFTVTATGATWRIPSTAQVATGDNVTFTFTVRDRSGNTSASRTIVVDVVDKDASATGSGASAGGDHDPVDTRRTWVLRPDLDVFTATFTSQTSPSAQQGATTTVASNNLTDLEESLRLVGLNTASMTAESAAATNGLDTGTNAIVARLLLARYRELMNERFGIDADGTRRASSVDVEFLLPGEQGSLASVPTYSTSNSSNSSKGFSEISIGGTLGADSSAYTASGTIGQAWFDPRNRRDEANLNTGGTSVTGIYLLGALKLQVNSNALFQAKVSYPFVAVHGGTPVGQNAVDDDVLAGAFDRTTSTDTTKNARYDAIMDAIEHVALYASAITAHEIGHSLGLVPDGGPKTGLFGAAHHSNTFTEATSASPNTSNHLDFLGNDLMAGATTFDSTTWTGSAFKRFSPLDLAYLLNRLVHDEGK